MNQRKLDPRLCEAIDGLYDSVPTRFPVSVRLAPEASGTQIARLSEILGRAIQRGQPTVAANVTLNDLSRLSDDPAVLTVRLARTFEPAASYR